jgi:crossover junction endodeoxyribonuclease RuvC
MAPAITGARLCLRVLGVDPAAAGATGYGIVECAGRSVRMLHTGALKLHTRLAFPARLCEIHRIISGLIGEYSPDALAVESVFAALNQRTALQLAEVRGVILLAAGQAGIPAHSYSPREVKSSVAGYGNASKQQVQEMVKSVLQLTEAPHPSDAADALAVALCHAQWAQSEARLGVALIARKRQSWPRAVAITRAAAR